MHPAKFVGMALLCGPPFVSSHEGGLLRASVFTTGITGVSPSRTAGDGPDDERARALRSEAANKDASVRLSGVQRRHLLLLTVPVLLSLSFVGCMYQPPAGGGAQASLRLPPRWDPSMETTLPFRTWLQDLMLWTICTDLNGPQQCAAIISQLGGAARELARTLTPAEVYNGGDIDGQHLDPVSFLLHGLSTRFAPLDEENRLRAAQDLLSFSRRQGETVDALVSRFDITRQMARREGGGAISVETAALILLRSCGVSSEQFQVLTQPFGLRLPANDLEFSQLCHHWRRMAHIVERHPNNIASGLRQQAHFSHTYLAEADTGSSQPPSRGQPEHSRRTGAIKEASVRVQGWIGLLLHMLSVLELRKQILLQVQIWTNPLQWMTFRE